MSAIAQLKIQEFGYVKVRYIYKCIYWLMSLWKLKWGLYCMISNSLKHFWSLNGQNDVVGV